jgi:hypothetical protein
MIEVEKRLRAELARTADAVQPAPDPMGRLLARRRRWRLRTGALFAAVMLTLTGTAIAGVATMTADPSPLPLPFDPDRTPQQAMLDEEITSPWTRQLLAAPTRGNLAGNRALVADLTRELTGRQGRWQVDPALDKVKVLLLADVAGARAYTVAYYNDTRAVSVSSSGPAGVTVAQLAGAEYGGGVAGLRPFTVSPERVEATGKPAYSYTTALAPPGCQIAVSHDAHFDPAGTVTQTWVEQGDYVVRPGPSAHEWWRFTCAGVVREVQEQQQTGTPAQAVLAGPPVTERGSAPPGLVTRALSEWQSLPGLPVSRYRALWGGTPPGATNPTVVLVGESPGGGVQVCALTGTNTIVTVASAVAHGPLDSSAGSSPPPAMEPVSSITTAVAASADLVAVRLPDRANPEVLSDQLLVIAPAAATTLQISGGDTPAVPLVAGVGIITAKAPAGLTIRANDGTGTTLAQLTVSEPDADGLLFGQALIRRW